MKAVNSRQALYLYCITRDDSRAALRADGIDAAATVDAVTVSEFTCWVSNVSRGFANDLPRRMDDLDWLAVAGVRHQRVVAEIATRTTALPARFGTIFLSERSLADHIKHRTRELMNAFKAIDGADEWGIKIFRLASAPAPLVEGESGADYLRRKSEAARARNEPREGSTEVKQFAAEMGHIARELTQGGSISQGQPGLAWQGSVLLPRARKRQFDSAVHDFAQQHGDAYRIEVTGPWPPYSFVKHG